MSVYDLHRIEMPQTPKGFADDSGGTHFVPAPCQVACPVGTDAPSYIALIWEEKYAEAFEAITATNPFSSICGRVCDAPCEPACRRTDSDGPLQIRNLKRFVMDKVGHRYDPPPVPVTKKESVGIVGSGPAGLTAAHDLCVAGYTVHVYEMSDRLGGMMAWGIPAFRLPPGIIDEDIDRLTGKCPGLHVHLDTELGKQVHLEELKERHDAVLLAIGSWWGKPMEIPGEEHPLVVDGVGFLRRVNTGERPQLPEKVVVVGGGDVAMDACRVARRLPGCEHVTVIYRRGPEEIPARRIELEGAVAEGIEFVYNTQQVSVAGDGEGLRLRCVKTEAGEPDESGRRSPVAVPGSEHEIECGMVIAAVGQKGVCAELDRIGMMLPDRVRTRWETMRTDDPKVFAAGDGAFGGSTIVMAMHHGQRAAYYIEQFLEGNGDPMPYRTPYRTRRVDVAQDMMWERVKLQHPEFFGLGAVPVEFPEIEATYDDDTARKEAARCYRCDAETGTPDYSVQHREDLFSMARIGPDEHDKRRAMLQRRLEPRDNPFPEERPAQLDDIVFLPANLSRLVIDPYREACRVDFDLGGRLALAHPFLVTGFDESPREVRAAVARGLSEARGVLPRGAASCRGRRRSRGSNSWLGEGMGRTPGPRASYSRSPPIGRHPPAWSGSTTVSCSGSRCRRQGTSNRRSPMPSRAGSTCWCSTAPEGSPAAAGQSCGPPPTSACCATPSPSSGASTARRRSTSSGSGGCAPEPTPPSSSAWGRSPWSSGSPPGSPREAGSPVSRWFSRPASGPRSVPRRWPT